MVGLFGDLDGTLAPNLLKRLSTMYTARKPIGPFGQIEVAQIKGTSVAIARNAQLLHVSLPWMHLCDRPRPRHHSLPSTAVRTVIPSRPSTDDTFAKFIL